MKISLLSDSPIGESDDGAVDGLNFSIYAEVLASAIRTTQSPLTIGVFGEWGAGKTSLMHLVERDLATDDDMVTVWFNAWRYQHEEHPVLPLIATIVAALRARAEDQGSTSATGRSSAVGRLISALRMVAIGLSASAKVKIPGLAELEVGVSPKDAIDSLRRGGSPSATGDWALEMSTYYGVFEHLDALEVSDDSPKVAVLIDDLDRCLPDRALGLLESIKLVLSQPGFTFTLGLSNDILQDYVGHRYLSEFGLEPVKAKLYLDKMIQLAFRIPPNNDERVAGFAHSLASNADVPPELIPLVTVIGTAVEGNPRGIKRLVNSVIIDASIFARLRPGEPAPVHVFALTRCLQQTWTASFRALMTEPGLAGAAATWIPETLKSTAETSSLPAARTLAAELLGDRRLRDVLMSDLGHLWLSNHDLREQSLNFLVEQARMAAPQDLASQPEDVLTVFGRAEAAIAAKYAQSLRDAGAVVTMQDLAGLQTWLTDPRDLRSLLIWGWQEATADKQLEGDPISELLEKSWQHFGRTPAIVVAVPPGGSRPSTGGHPAKVFTALEEPTANLRDHLMGLLGLEVD